MYFDQLAAMYNSYTVVECDTKLTVVPTGTNPVPCVCSYYASNTNTSGTFTQDEAREQKGAVQQIIAGSNNIGRLRHHAKIYKLLGAFSEDILEDKDYTTSTGANPTDILYGVLNVATLDSSTLSLYCEVVLEYRCYFSVRKSITAS